MKARIILTAILFLAAVTAKAENGWSVENTTGSTFRITRSTSGTTETVKYRTVNLSAYAGQHYTAVSGEVTFGVNDTYKDITVSEDTQTTGAYLYQTGTKRKYRFDVTDQGGFHLAHCDREITTGTEVPGNGAFDIKEITIQSSEYQNSDAGYDKNVVKSVSSSNYFSSTNVAPKAYYQLIGAELRMTLSMDVKEKNDGYQYLSILTSTSLYDNRSGCSNGDPGNISNSLYMAGFEHKTGGKDTEYKSYSFPVTSVGNNEGHSNPWGHGTQYILSKQKFNTNRRADDGRLVLPMDFSVIAVRCNASGGGTDNDEWYAKNVTANIQAVDVTNPTVSAVSVAPGRHSKGNTVYVSVAFSEIVTVSSAKLTSNWGDLSYVAGSGSNVLTFSRTIPASASSALNITGYSGIADLAGKAPTSVTASSICSVDESYAYTITYNLDEGSVATDNPTSYTWETATFTLNNPTRLGYYFDGWTGSNGNTPQTTVTIANHSHGNKSYTANWTKVWTGSGSQGDPYTITTTKGMDLLAQYVNSGNNCSSLFFQLGGPIEYSYTNAWNVASEENNYTAIGTNDNPFQGTFDGNNNTISGIRIYKGGNDSADKRQALFGAVTNGGIVKRVTLTDARITGYNEVGGIAGYTYSCTIEDCTVAADVCIHAVQSNTCYHGGIVGFNQAGPVRRCISRATLTVANLSSQKDFGGIAGFNSNNITDCIAAGVVIPDVQGLGAIVALNNSGTLTRNYYYDCKVASDAVTPSGVGVGTYNSTVTSDPSGAKPLYAVTLPEHASLTREPSATLPGSGNKTYTNGADIAGSPYAVASSNLLLTYDSSFIPSGYALASISAAETTSGTAVTVTDNGDYTYNLTMPAADVTVTANVVQIISYIDADGTEKSCTNYTVIQSSNSDVTLGSSGNSQPAWYVVPAGTVTVNGKLWLYDPDVRLILCDGATLNVTCSGHALRTQNGALTIYGQSQQSGILNATSNSNSSSAISSVGGDIVINGGTVNANAYGEAIYARAANIIINRGSVTANSGNSDGIYANQRQNVGGDITINGGIVTATATGSYYGIYANGTITLGCPTAADRIYASSYSGTVVIATGQTLTDGNSAHSYSGTLISEQIAAIAGKTLMKALGPVSYMDENGTEQTCTEYTILSDGTIPIDGNDRGNIGTSNQDTWYVASGNYFFSNHFALKANGHVHLILSDGATFTVSCSNYGIYGSSLTIYGQSEGTGSLVASTTAANNAQGAIDFSGALTINGGNVSTSSVSGFGIYGHSGSTLTINGGNVNAICATYGINGYNGDIILGWTRATDRIYASSYGSSGTIRIKDGQAFSNGTEILSGTITDMSKLDGKTLVPATNAIVYIDADGSKKYCTEYTAITNSEGDQTLGTDGETNWYVVSGDVTIGGKLRFVNSHSHIVICDGAKLTINVSGKDALKGDDDITFYGQTLGDGTINATGDYSIIAYGHVTINGGIINATGGSGIYTSHGVTINDGNVNATGTSKYGIYTSHSVTINGGNVNATGTEKGIYSGSAITLGWTKPTDRITANSYYCNGTISIKSGQAFTDGIEDLSGAITDMSKLDGKTLRPSPVGDDWSATLTAHKARLYGEEYYWTTFYHATWNYHLPVGVQAFIMKSDKVLYRIGDGTIVPAGCAVVIMADDAIVEPVDSVTGTITLTATNDAPVGISAGLLEANILRGVSTATASSILAGSKQLYVLGGTGSGNLTFLRFSGSTVPAGNAFYVK